MATPLPTAKQTVSLATSGPRVSRIRRDPPPPPPEVILAERQERESRMVMLGVIVFALALVVIGIAVMSYAGSSPRSYHLDV